jgi:hypothetical protein
LITVQKLPPFQFVLFLVIISCLPVALYSWLRHSDGFRSALAAALDCGGDADTVGAILAALSGATVGKREIPMEWLNNRFLLRQWRKLHWNGCQTIYLTHVISADLIVFATHGYGPFRRVLLGSISKYLACLAPCAVLGCAFGRAFSLYCTPL